MGHAGHESSNLLLVITPQSVTHRDEHVGDEESGGHGDGVAEGADDAVGVVDQLLDLLRIRTIGLD